MSFQEIDDYGDKSFGPYIVVRGLRAPPLSEPGFSGLVDYQDYHIQAF